MKELEEILRCIMDVYNQDISNDEKYEKVSMLWTRYYQLSSKLGVYLDSAYHLYLVCENECYKIYQEPVMKEIDKSKVWIVVNHLKDVLEHQRLGIMDGLSRDEVKMLLDFVVGHTRASFEMLGIDIKTNSLNGFCELGQILSIHPFENLGLKVTKNKASDAFDYPFHHVFGTVSFPILENGVVLEERYLIDTTYRQFFSSVRCNEGRYYAKEENTGMIANPDPGYFVRNRDFAKDLMRDGYVILNLENAYQYGEGFYLASLGGNDKKMKDDRNFDYYHAIIHSSSDYVIRDSEMDGMDIDCLNFSRKERSL